MRALLERGVREVAGERAARQGYWLHAMGPPERNIEPSERTLAGHTLVLGTTGSGKTRLLDLLVTQAVLRGEAVVIIDPKGDHDLREAARSACALGGDPERFVMFHPAFPERSVRIDPLRTWNRSTELASRIAALIPSETGADPFTAFGWMALNSIVDGLLLAGERPNLLSIRRYIEGGPENLVRRALAGYFERHVSGWRERAAPYLKRTKGEESEAYVQLYLNEVIEEAPSPQVDGLVTTYKHNREHFQKMVASLIPILSMLSAEPLPGLLSPRPDAGDERPLTDLSRLIEARAVTYVGLDGLADARVGSAIGSILLSDLTAVAGDRYDYGGAELAPVNLFVDEAAEVLTDPFIQVLNKGRGAGMRVTLAAQTIADFAARTGSREKAKQVLANANTLVALRTLDEDTQKFIARGLPLAHVRRFEQSRSAELDDGRLETKESVGVKHDEVELFPPGWLGRLPDLHYVARLAGGRIVKARLPILSKSGAGAGGSEREHGSGRGAAKAPA